MNQVNDAQEKTDFRSNGRLYHAPRLFVYGAVRELTAAGTGSEMEDDMMKTTMTHQRP